MNINLTDDRTTVGSYDNRSSGGVLLMPKERHMREGAPIQPHANALLCAKPAGRFRHCQRRDLSLTYLDVPSILERMASARCRLSGGETPKLMGRQ